MPSADSMRATTGVPAGNRAAVAATSSADSVLASITPASPGAAARASRSAAQAGVLALLIRTHARSAAVQPLGHRLAACGLLNVRQSVLDVEHDHIGNAGDRGIEHVAAVGQARLQQPRPGQ